MASLPGTDLTRIMTMKRAWICSWNQWLGFEHQGVSQETFPMVSKWLTKRNEIDKPGALITSKKAWPLLPSQSAPEQPFHNVRASRSGDWLFLCSSGTQWGEFWSSKVVKRSVGLGTSWRNSWKGRGHVIASTLPGLEPSEPLRLNAWAKGYSTRSSRHVITLLISRRIPNQLYAVGKRRSTDFEVVKLWNCAVGGAKNGGF